MTCILHPFKSLRLWSPLGIMLFCREPAVILFERDFAEGSALKSIGSNVFGRTGALANIKSIALPEGLETISATAFQQSGMESVTVPSTVTSIGNNAFIYPAKCYQPLGGFRDGLYRRLYSKCHTRLYDLSSF